MESGNPELSAAENRRKLSDLPSFGDEDTPLFDQHAETRDSVEDARSLRTSYALLIPLTSSPDTKNASLKELVSSFITSVQGSRNSNNTFTFVLGLPGHLGAQRTLVSDLFRKMMPGDVVYHLRFVDTSKTPNKIKILMDLAEEARESSDFFLILRDDVKFKSRDWPETIRSAFGSLRDETHNTFGFGCVSFLDESFPGFPSFPVVHRTALNWMGWLFPSTLLECPDEPMSDDTPEALIFESFLRFKAAKILSNARLSRQVRKRTQKDSLLRSRFLSKHLNEMLQLLAPHSVRKLPHGSIDVVTPSFRATREVLERILSLPEPDDCVVRFIIVCDNPDSKQAVSVFQEIEENHAANCKVRIRMNPVNVGPGGTRNHGLAESCADYVLFLDDDVLVERGILKEYWALAKKHPDAAGFIGRTILPGPQTPRQFAVKSAGIASFWDISSQTTRDLPWGITANLFVKRDPDIFFYGCEVFSRGGGGEDVDFCMRLNSLLRERSPGTSRSFVPAPKAMVHHPYWNNGACHLKQFFGWSKGDSALMVIHPKFAFRSLPDFTESLALYSLGLLLLLLLEQVSVSSTVIFLASYIFAEWLYEVIRHLELIPQWGLAFTALVGLETCVMRTWSEIGRFVGQFERGEIIVSLFSRFDWFQENWPEYPNIIRQNQLKRGLFRLALASSVVHGCSIVFTKQ